MRPATIAGVPVSDTKRRPACRRIHKLTAEGGRPSSPCSPCRLLALRAALGGARPFPSVSSSRFRLGRRARFAEERSQADKPQAFTASHLTWVMAKNDNVGTRGRISPLCAQRFKVVCQGGANRPLRDSRTLLTRSSSATQSGARSPTRRSSGASAAGRPGSSTSTSMTSATKGPAVFSKPGGRSITSRRCSGTPTRRRPAPI